MSHVTTRSELEDAIVEIWETAQNAESSRAGMQMALDQIQEQCVEVVPNVDERARDFDDEEDAGTSDDDETD